MHQRQESEKQLKRLLVTHYPNYKMDKNSFEPLVDEALDAFWEIILNRFPEAKHGDLSPLATLALDSAAEKAVKEWIGNNVPEAEAD